MARPYKSTRRSGAGRRRSRALAKRSAYRAATRAANRALYVRRTTGYRIPRHLMGQPKKKVIKFRYADNVFINPSLTDNVNASHVFSANGMFDPDITATGHKPRGFDQWKVFYDHYVVIKSKITVKYTMQDVSSSPSNAMVGIMITDDGNTPTYANAIAESNHARWRWLGNTEGRRAEATLSMHCKPHKFLGRSKPLSDSELKAPFTANPTEQVYYNLFAAGFDGAVDTDGIECFVVIEYTAVLIEPKDIPAS